MKNWLIKMLGGITREELEFALEKNDRKWEKVITSPQELKMWKLIFKKSKELMIGLEHDFLLGNKYKQP